MREGGGVGSVMDGVEGSPQRGVLLCLQVMHLWSVRVCESLSL